MKLVKNLSFLALAMTSACGESVIEEGFNNVFYETWDAEITELPRPTVVPEQGTALATSILQLETPDGTLSSSLELTLDFGAASGGQVSGYAENFVMDGEPLEGSVAITNGTIFAFSTGSTVDRLADGKGNINSTLATEIPIRLNDGRLVNVKTPLFAGGLVGDLDPSHITLEDDNAPGWYGTETRLLTPDEDRFEVNAQLRGQIQE